MKSQVPISKVSTSKPLSPKVPVNISRPRHNVKLKNILGSRKEALLIKRNLLLLKKNA